MGVNTDKEWLAELRQNDYHYIVRLNAKGKDYYATKRETQPTLILKDKYRNIEELSPNVAWDKFTLPKVSEWIVDGDSKTIWKI